MSGVLFVVYIPSRAEEQRIRERYVHDQTHQLATERKQTPMSTPEMQRAQCPESDESEPETAERSLRRSLLDPVGGPAAEKSDEDPIRPTPKRCESIESEPEYLNDLGLAPDAFMEDVMMAIMKKKRLRRVTWLPTKNVDGHQILFNIENGARCDDTIRLLSEWGVGEREGTSVSVLPCSLYYEPIHETKEEKCDDKSSDSTPKDTGWSRFLSSTRARMNVAEIVHEVRESAQITFDFLCLVVVAGILAAFGLVEDSTLFLAASMLISPLMGPIIAGIFGSVIKDRNLQILGVFNELIGLFVATSVGFLFGIIVCGLDDKYGVGEGLTNEILSRCELHSVLVGILIALPSGAAVAIAILGDNTGSLVGVAISASLLPPAVNAGLLWALSLVYLLFEKDLERYNSVIKTSYYSEHQSVELAIFGCISMCVTVTNIICIYIMGVVFLKIKEVAPLRSHRQFWHHDVKIARDYNKTIHIGQAGNRPKDLSGLKLPDHVHGIGVELFKSQNTWSPMNHHFATDRPHMKDLESFYMTLALNSGGNHPRLFNRHSQVKSPAVYKSIPDENILLPSSSKKSPPMDTPAGPQRHPSNSFPANWSSKRFVVTPSREDPLRHSDKK